MANMFEGDNETPWLTPQDSHSMGFAMVLYPTTLLFRLIQNPQKSVRPQARRGVPKSDRVGLAECEEILDLPYWAKIEDAYGGGPEQR